MVQTKEKKVSLQEEENKRMKNNKDKKEFTFWAPFKLLKEENLYWFCLITLFISLLGVITSVLNGDFQECVDTGAIYSTFIAIIAPFLVDFFVELTVKRRKDQTQNFITYKSLVFGISVLYIVFSSIIIMLPIGTNYIIQGLYLLFSVFYYIYIYLVIRMDDHEGFLADYTDSKYAETEKQHIKGIISDAAGKKEYQEDGRTIKL